MNWIGGGLPGRALRRERRISGALLLCANTVRYYLMVPGDSGSEMRCVVRQRGFCPRLQSAASDCVMWDDTLQQALCSAAVVLHADWQVSAEAGVLRRNSDQSDQLVSIQIPDAAKACASWPADCP